MGSRSMKYPRYSDRCRNFEKTKKLICYVCPDSLQKKEQTWDKHVTDPQHLSVLESFNKSFCETKLQVVCKLCSKSFAKEQTVKHAVNHKFSPWHKPKDLNYTFVKHFIAHIADKYYCHLCKKPFSFWHMALNHVNDSKHQCLQRDKISEDVSEKLYMSVPRFKSLINHSIFPILKNSWIFECMVCDRAFNGPENFEEHVKGRRHKSHEDQLADRLKGPIVNEKQGAVNEGKFPIGEKSNGKCDGSTAPQAISSRKRKSKAKPTSKCVEVVIPAVQSKLSLNMNCAEEMSLKKTTVEASSPARKFKLPNRQLRKVIHIPSKHKAEISCKTCTKKLRDNVELHVHLTNHFWPRFVKCGENVEEQQIVSSEENIPNGLSINGEDVIQCQENYPSIASAAPLEMSKLIEHFADMRPFFGQNEFNVSAMLNRMPHINETKQVHLLSSKNEEQTINDHAKIEKCDPAVITFKGISRLQYFENLNKQLAPITEISTEESNVLETATRFYKSPSKTPHENNVSAKKQLPADAGRISKKVGDVKYNHSDNDYIYQIDTKQLHDIELGIILSFTRDKNNIYCLICRKNFANSLQDVHEHLCNAKHIGYLKQMQEDHSKFTTFPELFSDLHLALHFMEEMSDQDVQCWACEEVIQNDPTILRQHIKIGEHLMKSKKFIEDSAKLLKQIKTRMARDWYNVQYYWCVVCSTRSISENHFVEHLHSMKHNKNCWKFQVLDNIMFDFCPTCATMWLGFQCTFAYHSECRMHKYHARDNFYHVTKLPNEAKNFLNKLQDIIEEILKSIDGNSNDEKSKEEKLVCDLLEVAQEEFYRARVYPFGSRVSGLALKNSDFDVFIDCGNMYEKNNSMTKVKQCLKALEGSLKNRPKTWKINRTVIDNVKVPLINVCHRPTGIECDVSFTNGLSVEKTQLITNYIEMYPLCRILSIFMKKWIMACDLMEPNGLTSYALVWMVIFYLQKQDIVPSVADLIRFKGESKIIAGWETGVGKIPYIRDTRFSIVQLIQGFFNTYSQFDYRHNVICPLMGESVEKQNFVERNLPDEMWPYTCYLTTQMNTSTNEEELCINSAICVQDPFDLSQNLTSNVKKFMVHRLRVFCSLSAQMIQ